MQNWNTFKLIISLHYYHKWFELLSEMIRGNLKKLKEYLLTLPNPNAFVSTTRCYEWSRHIPRNRFYFVLMTFQSCNAIEFFFFVQEDTSSKPKEKNNNHYLLPKKPKLILSNRKMQRLNICHLDSKRSFESFFGENHRVHFCKPIYCFLVPTSE